MPLTPFELEIQSVTRWWADTFSGVPIVQTVVAEHFARPTILVETPRTTEPPFLSAARRRETSIPIRYFGKLDIVSGAQPWAPFAFAGKLEAALQDITHRIPLRNEGGSQVGVLVVDCDTSGVDDTDLSITLRYKRLVPERQPELEGQTLASVNFRQV